MKILVANKFFYKNGGSEQVLFQEREYLKRQGIDIVDFAMRDDRNYQSAQSEYFVDPINYNAPSGIVSRIVNSCKLVHSSEAVKKIRRLVEKERPNIAHLHNIYHQLTPSIIPTLKKQGVKIVLTMHDYKLICPAYNMRNGSDVCGACEGKSFWKLLSCHCQCSISKEVLLMVEAYWHRWKKSYEYVDVFIAPSKFLAETVSARISKEKIVVLPNGIDPDVYNQNNKDDGYCLFLGRISKEKGVRTLLKAYSLIKKSIKLKIVGTGPEEAELSRQFPEIEFLGFQDGETLKNTIANASFIAAPSEWNENCSMAILESMAAGKPVIGSRIGGIPEQIVEGETGFLFENRNHKDLAEKIWLLSEDIDLRFKMGAAGRRRLEMKYSKAAHCTKLMNIYYELQS